LCLCVLPFFPACRKSVRCEDGQKVRQKIPRHTIQWCWSGRICERMPIRITMDRWVDAGDSSSSVTIRSRRSLIIVMPKNLRVFSVANTMWPLLWWQFQFKFYCEIKLWLHIIPGNNVFWKHNFEIFFALAQMWH
jgi:hypothetical protein